MSNLTGLQNGVFNTLQLIDDTTGDSTEVRQLFLQGSIENTIPNNPTNTQVLSIPGLLPELNARQLIVNSYSKNSPSRLALTFLSGKPLFLDGSITKNKHE